MDNGRDALEFFDFDENTDLCSADFRTKEGTTAIRGVGKLVGSRLERGLPVMVRARSSTELMVDQEASVQIHAPRMTRSHLTRPRDVTRFIP